MKTLPTPEEIELERTRNIELRLSKFHALQKDESELQRINAQEEKQTLDAIDLYKSRDDEIYTRLLENQLIEGVKA